MSTTSSASSFLPVNPCGDIVQLITLVILSLFTVAWGFFKWKFVQQSAQNKTVLENTPVPPDLLENILKEIQNLKHDNSPPPQASPKPDSVVK